MLYRIAFLFLLFLPACVQQETDAINGPLTKQEINQLMQRPDFYQKGTASYYANRFHGKQTSNGEAYDTSAFTAAHKSLPFNTVVELVNVQTGNWVTVRINDRGPYHKQRIIDLSARAAQSIGLSDDQGITQVLLFVKE